MRFVVASLAVAFGLQIPVFAQNSCPSGTTTSISGIVYAPNGKDPLPNVTVYVPTTTVDAFTPGVSCPVQGAQLPGLPQVGTVSAVDGSFTINNVPVATNVPLVIVTGRWRRQVTVDTTANACGNTVVNASLTNLPTTQAQGDIPKFAIATGNADQVECVLLKVGIDQSEFTNPSGTGRINLYQGDGKTYGGGAGGVVIDSTTPTETTLMSNGTTLNGYDVLMLPCEGGQTTEPADQLSNLVSFANAGGRVYSSHYGYSWMWQNPPFNTVASWTGNTTPAATQGEATVVTNFADGQTLSSWLQDVGASTTPGQIAVSVVKRDISGINAPTQSFLTLNVTGNPVMQFVWDTPVGQTSGQCGRVLFNEYHVENPSGTITGKTFPSECPGGALTPQEKLLEYSLFELTNDGGAATLTPTSQDFGSQAVNFPSAPKPFTWTNNSTFEATVSLVNATGDFSASGCTSPVAGGASCTIQVVFTPTALGARTGTLSVGSGSQTLTASLTGTGVPDLSVSPTSLNFGSLDVGVSLTKSVTVMNSSPASVTMPALTTTGDYTATTNCPSTVPPNSTCAILITFKPTVYGTRTGTVGPADPTNPAYGQMNVTLTGNGLDFGLALAPSSGTVIAGLNATSAATVTPLGGFAAPMTLACSTTAPGSTCTVSNSSFTPSAAVTATVTITTTSGYTVVGYGALGGSGLLVFFAAGSCWLLWSRRRDTRSLLRISAVMFLLCGTAFAITGCGGAAPGKNANPTGPGTYSYTLTATDGTITHSTTYSLTVTSK